MLIRPVLSNSEPYCVLDEAGRQMEVCASLQESSFPTNWGLFLFSFIKSLLIFLKHASANRIYLLWPNVSSKPHSFWLRTCNISQLLLKETQSPSDSPCSPPGPSSGSAAGTGLGGSAGCPCPTWERCGNTWWPHRTSCPSAGVNRTHASLVRKAS